MSHQKKIDLLKSAMLAAIVVVVCTGTSALSAAPQLGSENTMRCDFSAAARVMGAEFLWEGACLEGLPTGRGMAKFSDGRLYAGEMATGIFDGGGTITLPDGSRYTGEFTRGQYEGHGVYTFPNGDRYVGEFAAGLMHGRGIYRRFGGEERYEVEYERGKQIRFEVVVPAAMLLEEPALTGVLSPMLRQVVKVHQYILHTLGLRPTYTSGYRDASKNAAVGGALHSLHMAGRAVDLVVPGISSEQERMVADYARKQGLGALWHGEGENYHLHLQLEAE